MDMGPRLRHWHGFLKESVHDTRKGSSLNETVRNCASLSTDWAGLPAGSQGPVPTQGIENWSPGFKGISIHPTAPGTQFKLCRKHQRNKMGPTLLSCDLSGKKERCSTKARGEIIPRLPASSVLTPSTNLSAMGRLLEGRG